MIHVSDIFKFIHQVGQTHNMILLEDQVSKWGYLAIGEKRSIVSSNSDIVISNSNGVYREQSNPWDALEKFRQGGGWTFGYLSYDLKNAVEELNSKNTDEIGLPEMYFFEPKYLYKIDFNSNHISQISESAFPSDFPQNLDLSEFKWKSALESLTSRDDYISIVQEAQQQIFEGQFYEVNLSRLQKATFTGNPLSLYLQMRGRGPVPFASYLKINDVSICCSSPERFLKKSGKTIISEPIKGTVSTKLSEVEVEKNLLSEKNKAENLMIVDLVRHDFNHVAITGSVVVDPLFEIRKFSTVHHLVSTIKGQLSESVSTVEAIKKCFPMGSMTGAPKISAMKAIDALESYKRGLYSGAIGYFTPEDNFDFNVVIRSAICKNQTCYYSSGGAITSDSIPDEEWEETKIKTLALRADV